MADVTYYYGWGPRDGWAMTWSELNWWLVQATRLNKLKEHN
ncbi:GpE family phage tail protein [Ewingella americana]|uniref:GpE family phage tail protein n=1 Tax=Ewingella americana TaxID=41202 RepID=A0A502GM05_9GAMM|nr:GpE family phage tail protein [Ewingella americana]